MSRQNSQYFFGAITMIRKDIFSFRVNQNERNQILKLSKMLKRSQSDAIRYVVSIITSEINFSENVTKQLSDKLRPNLYNMTKPDKS